MYVQVCRVRDHITLSEGIYNGKLTANRTNEKKNKKRKPYNIIIIFLINKKHTHLQLLFRFSVHNVIFPSEKKDRHTIH